MRAAKIAGLLAGAALAVSAFCLAASADTVRLTPAQTVALVGNSIEGQVWSTSLGQYVPAYAVVTSFYSPDYVPANSFADMFIYNTNGSYPAFSQAFPDFADRSYVVYALSSSPFVTSWPSWVPQDNSTHSDFTCDFSLPIQGCSSIRFSVLYTSAAFSGGYYGNVSRSTAILQNSAGVVAKHPLGQANINQRYWLGLWPFYNGAYGSNGQSVPENARQSLAMIPLDYSAESVFSVSGFSLALNMVRGAQIDNDSPFHGLYNGTPDSTYLPLLLIECPQISDYVPVETTTAATTRREYSVMPPQSTAPAHTVDLSNLESGVAAIVQQEQEMNNNLEWIGNNMVGAVNNLALICNKLDDIYRDMVKSGQIPSNLFPVDETFMNEVQNGLTSYTTARIPDDARAGLTFWAWFMGKIMEQAWIAELAALGSCLAVTYFVLFRGRNS